jgi:hypothetical protein
VGGLDFFRTGEIGDGAADFEDPAVGAGAQAQFVDRGFEQSFRVIIHRAITLDISRAHLGVGVHVSFLKPLQLNRPHVVDPLADELRGFAGVAAGEILIADRRHFDLNVDAVEERAGDAGAIALDLQRRADAFFLRIGEKTARTRDHGGDQHDAGGIVDRAEGAGDRDVAVFQRLPHDLEDVAPEFRQLVKEQDPITAPIDRPFLVLTVSLPKRR